MNQSTIEAGQPEPMLNKEQKADEKQVNPSSANAVLADGLEVFLRFLNNHGVKAELTDFDRYGFSRTIAFRVYGIDYRIIWFKNESNLQIGTHVRAARIPFRYMYYDECFPLVGGNESIGFSYVKMEKKSMFDREYPYEVFRLPLELACDAIR